MSFIQTISPTYITSTTPTPTSTISSTFPVPSNPLDVSGWVLRSGVIPYAIHDGQIFLLLGRKTNNKWTDFGGGCRYTKKETPYQCATRELKEESLDSVRIQRNNIRYMCVTGHQRPHQIILFIQIPWNENLPIQFQQRQAERLRRHTLFKKHKELQSIHWVSLTYMCSVSKHCCDDSLKSIRSSFSKNIKHIEW